MRIRLLCLLASGAVLHAATGDLRGVWKADGKAYLNLETAGVIVDPPSGKIPYRPEARIRVAENFAKRASADPDARCFQPGVPRATGLPYRLQILENARAVYIVYERAHSYRILYLDGRPHNDGLPYTMGDSRAHWEGSTLVADVASFSDQTWLDGAGHYHSDQLHVVERYTRTSPETIAYEATIEDPTVFTAPWKLRVTLRRQPGAELTEDECEVDSNGARHHVAPSKDSK
ncbi:MAG: hypothetical protein C5B51_07780 [Terriglobia bacterium]|nr:MAG: hypothetical protein C5B51_07780 [Terriglobia bacterium]